MIKKRDTESIRQTGLGILNGLSDLENTDETAETKSKLKESNYTKEYKSKSSLEQKSKRSFMLTDKQIEMVYLLKAKNPSKDLSTIVGEAIEKYYEST